MSPRAVQAGEGSVAVILTCYEEGRCIGDAVRSVLNQTRADAIAQIVIADDGSAGETLDVLQHIERWDARIQVLYGPSAGQACPAQRNLAIACTSAPLIAILDGDDWWCADKLEQQLPVMRGGPRGRACSVLRLLHVRVR